MPDVPPYNKSTFGIRVGNLRESPSLEEPPPHLWPRCIPKVCVPYLKKHQVGFISLSLRKPTSQPLLFQAQLGACLSEFDECVEYIFDRLVDQCPSGQSGPTCALLSYWDNSAQIDKLFEGSAPQSEPENHDIDALNRLLDRLVETRYKALELLTGEAVNTTTLAPITIPPPGGGSTGNEGGDGDDSPSENENSTSTEEGLRRRKRSYVPLTCNEIVRVMEDINDLVQYVIDDKVFHFATIYRFCDYIFDTPVTHEDCIQDSDSLEAEIETLKTNIQELYDETKGQIVANATVEMARIKEEMDKFSVQRENLTQIGEVNFTKWKEAEEEKRQEAVANREKIHTTLPPWCVCPSSDQKRRKRQAETNETTVNSDDSGGNATTESPNSNENGTTPEPEANATTIGVSTTTWPDTCICPEEEEPETNATIPNGNATTISPNSTSNATEAPSEDTEAPNEDTEAPSENTETPNENTEAPNNSTEAPLRRKRHVGRKRRPLDVIEDFDLMRQRSSRVRSKRSIEYRCNSSVVFGLMFYDMYHKEGIKATKCCIPDYPGELFNFTATIDSPWINALADPKDRTFKEWKKMVDQEVRYLFLNKEYSALKLEGILDSIEFVEFTQKKSKVAVVFQVHLNTPHWDNDRRIENAFTELIEIYRNQSADEKNVLGKGVLGRYTKRDYVVNDPPNTHTAKRIPIEQNVVVDEGNSTANATLTDTEEDEGLPLLFVILVPLGSLLILCIPFILALRTKACLCRQWC